MTFDELDETVIPRLGICYRDMSFSEIVTVYNGIIKEKSADHEYLMKAVHNAARLQAFFTVISNPFGKSKIKRPDELMKFPWEIDESQKPTPEQIREWNKLFPDTI